MPFRLLSAVRQALTAGRVLGLCGLLLAAGLMGVLVSGRKVLPVQAAATRGPQPALQSPDDACIRCHAAIVASYRQTSMGRGSGAAMAGLFPGSFDHAESGIRYRIFTRDGRAWMSFNRPATDERGLLQGEQELLYFVGSAKRGRTYLYQQEGEWFELPINWYTRQDHWAMAPAFDDAQRMPAPLPVDANCMHCHASAVETPLPEAGNRFPVRPFDQGGIGCSACHGDPAAHLAAGGHGPILNPAKMGVAARDSACVQCHLEGDAVVYKPGQSLAKFQPGDVLSNFAVYFVRRSQTGGGQRASSQYEALLKSACKRGAGDALTCTSCHDPHSNPAPAQRVQFFRSKCLACHTSPLLATAHHPEQPDCAVCHMPSRKTADISHEQVTDHDIEAVPAHRTEARRWIDGEELVPVGTAAVGPRELGLAYAQRAEKGDQKAAQRGLALLRQAEAHGADDLAVHVNLGFLEQQAGETASSRSEYAAALRLDAYQPTALTNRSVLDARSGDVAEAVRLLDRLVRADPSQSLAGLDLLQLECAAGEESRVSATLESLLAVHPDDAGLRAFAASTAHGLTCAKR